MENQSMNNSKIFKILSIDGGGVRGVFAAKILALMEEKFHIKVHEHFDLIVGTSTGSIIAGAISVDYNLSDLVDDYVKNAPLIFRKRWSSLCGLLRSKYGHKVLARFLYDRFKDIKLKEIKQPLILNATNVSAGDVYVFKSAYQEIQRTGDYVRDGDVPLYKAVLASCSAPTYFNPVDINGTLVCDGGMWANNPSLVGYTDAINNFQVSNNGIKILSLGSGQTRQAYRSAKMWGLLLGWQKTKLVDFLMSCQTKFPHNVLSLLEPEMIFRINPSIDNYELDKYQCIHTLIELAKNEFTKQNREIRNFLKIGCITV